MSNKNNMYRKQVNPSELVEKATSPVEAEPISTPIQEDLNKETTPSTVSPISEVPVVTKEEVKSSVEVPKESSTSVKKVESSTPKKTKVKGEEVYVKEVAGRRIVQKTLTDGPVVPDVNDKIAQLNLLLSKYVQIVSTKSPSEQTRMQFVQAFCNVAEFVLHSDSYAVYNRFYQFFVEERNKLVDTKLALCGIHKIYNGPQRNTITSFFTVFHAMVRCKVEHQNFGLSIRAIRRALGNDKFCNWIQAKLNNRTIL